MILIVVKVLCPKNCLENISIRKILIARKLVFCIAAFPDRALHAYQLLLSF